MMQPHNDLLASELKAMHSTSDPGADKANRDVLIADLEIVHQLFMQSEEIGEKRVQFFVGLVTAIGAGVSFLWAEVLKGPTEASIGLLKASAIIALLLILFLGVMTYARIVKRNLVSDEYKAIASHRYAQLGTDDPFLPLNDDAMRKMKPGGGLVQLVAAMNGVVLFLLILASLLSYGLSLKEHYYLVLAALLAAVVFSSLLWCDSENRRRRYAKALKGKYLQGKHWKQADGQSTA